MLFLQPAFTRPFWPLLASHAPRLKGPHSHWLDGLLRTIATDFKFHTKNSPRPLVLGLGVYVCLSQKTGERRALGGGGELSPLTLRVIDALVRPLASHFYLAIRAPGDHL